MMKTNYHTHHELCNHAIGKADDYVNKAIELGFEVLGFSDHAPSPFINDYGVRMRDRDFEHYLLDIEGAKRRAGEKIEVFSGLEVEFFENKDSYYKELLEKVDYLILGQHYISLDGSFDHLISGFGLKTVEEITKYAEFLEKAMESGYFMVLAHPDLYMNSYQNWDETAIEVAHRICKAAKKHDMILEFNANGFRRGDIKSPQGITQPYPRLEFFEIVKQYDLKTIISSDCHSPEFLYDKIVQKAESIYHSLGLQEITYLPIKKK